VARKQRKEGMPELDRLSIFFPLLFYLGLPVYEKMMLTFKVGKPSLINSLWKSLIEVGFANFSCASRFIQIDN
jgi:hypothetical protein